MDSCTNTWLNRNTQILERLLACLHDAGPFPKEISTVNNRNTSNETARGECHLIQMQARKWVIFMELQTESLFGNNFVS